MTTTVQGMAPILDNDVDLTTRHSVSSSNMQVEARHHNICNSPQDLSVPGEQQQHAELHPLYSDHPT